MMLGGLLILFYAGLAFIAFACFVVSARSQSLDDTAHDQSHGDLPHVPTDAELIERLRAFEGCGCEVGPVHSASNSEVR